MAVCRGGMSRLKYRGFVSGLAYPSSVPNSKHIERANGISRWRIKSAGRARLQAKMVYSDDALS